MLRQRSGRIINVASVSGVKGTAGQVNYSAAKGALVAATKALAQEVAKRNITVNAVAPGFIQTDMTAVLDEKELSKLIPMGRFGKVQEVADLVSFLASEKGRLYHRRGHTHQRRYLFLRIGCAQPLSEGDKFRYGEHLRTLVKERFCLESFAL